jgi:hypothetical protein
MSELMALIWENAGERYAPSHLDFKLHPKPVNATGVSFVR